MKPADRPALYVAQDDTMDIISAVPLRIEGGGADLHRFGAILQLTPGTGEDAGSPAQVGRGFALFLLLIAAAMVFAEMSWWPVPVVLAVAGWQASEYWARHQGPGVLAAPELEQRRSEHHVLIDTEDRITFAEAIGVARRIVDVWPHLHGLVDSDAAELLVANALRELAGVLERRQSMREMRDDLSTQRLDDLPADNPAVLNLADRRGRVAAALTSLDAEVERRMTDLRTTAVVGENFVREREIGAVTDSVDRELARLVPVDLPGPADPGTELAGRIDAVLAAYRELDARYGHAS